MDIVDTAVWTGLALICALFLYAISSPRKRLAPSPPSWPIIGHLPLLAGPDLPHIALAKLADQHGPIISLRAGSRPMLVVSSPEVARECLTTHDRAFASRPAIAAGRILGFGSTIIPWAPYGPYWLESRKLATLELLSPRRLLALSNVRDDATRGLVEGIGRACSESMVRVRDHLLDMVLGLILIMIGRRQLDFAGPEERRELNELIQSAFSQAGKPDAGDVFPVLRWMDVGGKEKAMEGTAGRIRAMTLKWMEERRRMGGLDEGMDFIDVLVSMADENKIASLSGSRKEEKDLAIVGILQSMIFGTVDTTSVTLEWALSELLNNRQALEKAQQEIDSKIGLQRKMVEADIEGLPYLQAIVKETLRLHPPGPLLVPHESIERCTVMGYDVPAGTQLIVNAWKIHRDPEWWPRSLEFEPDRFMGPHGLAADVDTRGHHFQLIPFGAGRRACPGTSLALSILHLTIARLLHAFEWKLPSGTPMVDMQEGQGLSSPKAVPLEVRVVPKHAFNLYS